MLRSAGTEFSKRVFDFIAEEHVSHVVLVSAFNRYLGNGEAGECRDAQFCPTTDQCISEFGAALRLTVDTLRGHDRRRRSACRRAATSIAARSFVSG